MGLMMVEFLFGVVVGAVLSTLIRMVWEDEPAVTPPPRWTWPVPIRGKPVTTDELRDMASDASVVYGTRYDSEGGFVEVVP